MSEATLATVSVDRGVLFSFKIEAPDVSEAEFARLDILRAFIPEFEDLIRETLKDESLSVRDGTTDHNTEIEIKTLCCGRGSLTLLVFCGVVVLAVGVVAPHAQAVLELYQTDLSKVAGNLRTAIQRRWSAIRKPNPPPAGEGAVSVTACTTGNLIAKGRS